jgi:hypothetical protein
MNTLPNISYTQHDSAANNETGDIISTFTIHLKEGEEMVDLASVSLSHSANTDPVELLAASLPQFFQKV